MREKLRYLCVFFFFFKQKTAYEITHSDWSSDVCSSDLTESFYLFEGTYTTEHGGYPLYWFASSEKCKRDRQSREQRLEAAEAELAEMAPKLNGYHLKTQAQILNAAKAILQHYVVEGFLDLR